MAKNKGNGNAGTETPTKEKTKCPVTRAEFLEGAKPLDVVINGQPYAAVVKEFKTGSFGFYLGDKVKVKIGNELVTCQMGLNIIAVGSGDADKE